ncbi:Maf family protein, partial [Lacticaseibacillus paracasei]
INERALPVLDPPAYVQSLATAKGQSLVPSYPGATIIAADTMVAFQGKLLGKPHDRAEAKQMITALGGQTHQVYTGLWVRLDNGSVRQQVVTTDVTFWPLSEPDVESYLAE